MDRGFQGFKNDMIDRHRYLISLGVFYCSVVLSGVGIRILDESAKVGVYRLVPSWLGLSIQRNVKWAGKLTVMKGGPKQRKLPRMRIKNGRSTRFRSWGLRETAVCV